MHNNSKMFDIAPHYILMEELDQEKSNLCDKLI